MQKSKEANANLGENAKRSESNMVKTGSFETDKHWDFCKLQGRNLVWKNTLFNV